MMKTNIYFKPVKLLLLAFAGTFLLTACPEKKTDPKPAAPTVTTPTATQLLSKTWSSNIVKEGNTTVFTNGSSTNIKPGYSNFKLDLRSKSAAKITEFDGRTFTGTWTISANEKTLTLSSLNPEPTDTGGTIAFTISELSAASLKITRSTSNRKTGATSTEYQLTNP